jgi:HK97 family phage prohead protease
MDIKNTGELVYQDSIIVEKELNDTERTLTQYISTKTLDRGKDVMTPDGVMLDDYRKNPIVLFMHDYKLPIGRSLWQKPDSKGVLAKTKFGTVPFADDVYSLHKEGILNGWSIGFKPKEWTFDRDANITTYKKWELYEYSSVTVPMNQDALDEAKSIVKSEEGLLVVNKGFIELQKEKSFSMQLEVIEQLKNKIAEIDMLLKNDDLLSSIEKLENEIEVIKKRLNDIVMKDIVKTGISGIDTKAIAESLSRDISHKIKLN